MTYIKGPHRFDPLKKLKKTLRKLAVKYDRNPKAKLVGARIVKKAESTARKMDAQTITD
jgi:hypothetical protein